MHNEAYVRAVLTDRARERDVAIRRRQLQSECAEPISAPSAPRLRWSRMTGRVRARRAGAYLT